MDCNKEDAIKAQQVAESKLSSEDYLGAKKFILKSQRLFPSLNGLNQMLAVADVHISASKATDELSANWHQILQLEESADEDAIRKQYRKLLLLLHPDKNKYAGAEAAFKLVQSAHQAFETEKELARASASVSVHNRFWTICSLCHKTSEHSESLEDQFVQCPQCLRSFLAVRLPRREEAFENKSKEENIDGFGKGMEQKFHDTKFEEMEKGTDKLKKKVDLLSSSSSEDFGKRRKKSNLESRKKVKMSSSSSSEEFKTAIRRIRKSKQETKKTKAPKEKRYTQTTSRRVYSRHRKSSSSLMDTDTDTSMDDSPKDYCRDSVNPVRKEDGCIDGADVYIGVDNLHVMNEKECLQGTDVHIGDCSQEYENTIENTMEISHPHKYENAKDDMKNDRDVKVHNGDCSSHQKYEDAEDETQKDQDVKMLLFAKLKSVIMNEFSGGEFQVVEVRQDTLLEPAHVETGAPGPSDEVLHMKVAVSFTHVATSARVHTAASEDCMVGGSEIQEEDEDDVKCEVPDNDVFNFDKGRQEECFEAGQIWAVYDDADGFPRFYAHIAEVLSVRPFRVRMNWLYPAKTISKDVKAWIKAGFAYTCGEFILGKTLTRKAVGMFSHIMAHESGEVSGSIHIYPQNGDVWALYGAWKPRKGKTRKCEPVQVISHHNRELGVQVVALFKVEGYKSIYCRKGFEGFQSIPESELTRFSHQIPAHYLIGDELNDLPKDCVDLDTAALN